MLQLPALRSSTRAVGNRLAAVAPRRVPSYPAAAYRFLSTEAQSGAKTYDNIILSSPAKGVTQITLNRPKALNALSSPLFLELNAALRDISVDDSIGAVVLTGSDKAFAAGADIKEMKDKEFAEVYKTDFLAHWTEMTKFRKPIVAAVSGYALGGGCELAMMCDIILASPTAVFGQPEINLGVIPGAGGTQRLTHAIGKSRAMEIVLTGKNFSAQEAAQWGLVSRVVEGEAKEGSSPVVDEAVKVAGKIARMGRIAVQSAKEGVNAAYELSLNEGLHFERRLFHQLFATQDQKIGMRAFAEKQKPKWVHK